MKKLAPIFFIIFLSSTLLSCTAPVEATPSPTPIPAPITTPLPVQIEGLEETTLRKINVSVEQSYSQIEEEFTQPIEETTSRILGNMGIATCEQEALCDARMNIALAIEAMQEEYMGGMKCYTGAKADGQITLTIPDYGPLNFSIQGRKYPPFFIKFCPNDPSDAPFSIAWIEALLNGFYEIWHIQVLTTALQDQDEDIRYAAADILKDLGPDAGKAVTALIRVISDDVEDVRMEALRALEAIGPSAIEAIPTLIEILDSESTSIRSLAADAIAAIKPQDEEVVEALINCLEKFDANPHPMIDALKEIGPAAFNAVPALANLLDEDQDYRNEKVLEALLAITGQDFGLNANQWLKWWEEQQ